jgi:hypothetical protein
MQDQATNHFSSLYALGYLRPVPVTPPDANLDPNMSSRERGLRDRGKMPGVKKPDGYWRRYSFVNEPFDPAVDFAKWHADGCNTGMVLPPDVFALDVDCLDGPLSAQIVALAGVHLGKAPMRVGRRPKVMLFYRIDPADRLLLGYRKLSFAVAPGVRQFFELLRPGQHVLMAGRYPVQPGEAPFNYEIRGGSMWPHAELTVVTWAQVEAFLSAALAELPEASMGTLRKTTVVRAEVDQDSLVQGDEEEIEALVRQIPNDRDYDGMIEMCGAIHGAAQRLADGGRSIFLDWCERWENGTPDLEECEGYFNTLPPPYGLGFDYLAKKAGRATGKASAALPSAYGLGEELELSEQEQAFAERFAPGTGPLGGATEDEDYEIGAPAKPETPIELIDPASFYGREPAEKVFYIPGVVPQGEVTMLTGQGGVGKSLLALQMLIAIALGKPILGVETVQAKCLGFFCEDDIDVLHARVRDICKAYGVDERELSGKLWLVCRKYTDNLLCTFERAGTASVMKATPLMEDLVAVALSQGVKVSCLDTIADIFGGDEINRQQVRQFVQGCAGRLAAETGGACIILGHPSKSGQAEGGDGTSGSTAWHGSVRSRLYLTHKGAVSSQLRELSSMKANYGPAGAQWTLEWRAGVLETVMAAATAEEGVKMVASRIGAAVLAAVKKANADGVRMVRGATTKASIVKILRTREPGTFKDVSDAEIGASVDQLMALGEIRESEVGRRSNRQPLLGLVAREQLVTPVEQDEMSAEERALFD